MTTTDTNGDTGKIPRGTYTLDDFLEALYYLDEAYAEHFTKRELVDLCAVAIHYLGALDCASCGVNTSEIGEYYMVTDAIWDAHGPADGCLCIGCLENRMGRRLRPDDFITAPANSAHERQSERLRDRLGVTTSPQPVGTLHPQVSISHGDVSALVDEKIAPLILALWRAGIATQESCQGGLQPGGFLDGAFIAFSSGTDADRFAALVHPWRLDDELHPERHPQFSPWQWCAGQHGDDLWVSVFFPAADLPAVTVAAENPDTRSFGEWLHAQYQDQLRKSDEADALPGMESREAGA
jgi:hypothetical protein